MTSLYKYKSFGANSLRMLCRSEVFYSKPTTFNDPLDCSPSLINDIKLLALEKLCNKMISNKFGEVQAIKVIDEYRCMSIKLDDYKKDKDAENYYSEFIVSELQKQLDLLFKNVGGVLSLSDHWNCPLMWSHYANEHKGICIEYDIDSLNSDAPKEVDYTGERGILISKLEKWIYNESKAAKREIEQKYYYTKAKQWKYEKEYRYVVELAGTRPAPFEVSGIYFGLRCDPSVVTTIVKLMRHSAPNLRFYRVLADNESFNLNRREFCEDEVDSLEPMFPVARYFTP